MATKSIAWESGGGYISLSYTGAGNGSISITSDANDSFDDRQQTVRIATSKGSPSNAVGLLVKQKGKSVPVGTVYDFSYTGTVQEVTLPKGKYKLQCWGAQGGTSSEGNAVGSKGGYSEGIITLTKVTTLYIFVGGKGASSGNGGWNGGGGAGGSTSYNSDGTYGYSKYACGGGATDICTVTSDMTYSDYMNNRSDDSLLSRFIVAGGGAGGSYRHTEVTTTTTSKEYIVNVQGKSYGSISGTTISGKTFREVESKYSDVVYKGKLNSGTYYKDSLFIVRRYSSTTLNSDTNLGVAAAYGSTSFTANSSDVYVIYTDRKSSNTYSNGTVYRNVTDTSTSTSSGESSGAQVGGGASGGGQHPGTQTSAGTGGAFGKGKSVTITEYRYSGGAGGGGWYGGGSAYSDSSTEYVNYSGGGSGFVNTASNAGSRPSGYTGLELDSGTTTAGNSSFESTSGGTETGHSGNGYARITKIA